MMSKPPAQSRPTPGEPGPTRTQSERPGLVSALLAGAALVGIAGALLAPVDTAQTHAANSAPSSAVVRTVANITPLDSARPLAGRVREAGANNASGQGQTLGCVDDSSAGGSLCIVKMATAQSSTSGDASSAPQPGGSDQLVSAVGKVADAAGKWADAFTAGIGMIPTLLTAGKALGLPI